MNAMNVKVRERIVTMFKLLSEWTILELCEVQDGSIYFNLLTKLIEDCSRFTFITLIINLKASAAFSTNWIQS